MDPSRELHQEMGITSNSLENIMVCSKAQQQEQQRKPRPQQEQALKCPRCDSTNTKFCYYNNYSLSQPRYFCKSCRRYWTKGGTLRNVPVGGGCRKNKRSSSSSSSKRSTSQDHHQPMMITSNNNPLSNLQYPSLSSYDCNDLSLAFARLQKQQQQQQTCGFDQDEHDDDDGSNNHHQNLSILGNSISHLTNNNAHFENFLGNPNSSSISNFHETPFHNFYYGGLENGNGGNGGEMMIPYHHHHQEEATTAAVVVSTMKQESEMNNNGRVLWGFPWQIGGSAEQENMMVSGGAGGGGGGEHHQMDSGREIWNNGLAPSWHGLLNSPLM